MALDLFGLRQAEMPVMIFLNEWVLEPEYLPAWLEAAAAIVALGMSVWAVWEDKPLPFDCRAGHTTCVASCRQALSRRRQR